MPRKKFKSEFIDKELDRFQEIVDDITNNYLNDKDFMDAIDNISVNNKSIQDALKEQSETELQIRKAYAKVRSLHKELEHIENILEAELFDHIKNNSPYAGNYNEIKMCLKNEPYWQNFKKIESKSMDIYYSLQAYHEAWVSRNYTLKQLSDLIINGSEIHIIS